MVGDKQQRRFLDYGILSRLSAVPLMARQAMIGSVSGRHLSPHKGSSVEFAEYREYAPGDDLRRLDWRAYARSDRFYVKEFEADTNLRCSLFLDTSGSMGYGSHGVTKLEYAIRIAATMSYLAVLQGDAVGLSCAGEETVTSLPPRRSASHLCNLFDQLEKSSSRGGTQLVKSLHELAETTKQRALVVVVSDLFVRPDELAHCFEHFRFRKHDLAVFHVLDPQEVNFAFSRPTRFIDLEGGDPIFAEPNAIEARYRSAMQTYLSDVSQVMRTAGVDYYRTTTDVSHEKCMAEFLIRRSQLGGKR